MVYKNINRRIVILAKEGYIEEIPYTKRTPHGRIDYKLTMKGFLFLIPYFLNNPSQMRGAVEYIDKFGLDKQEIVREVMIGHNNVIDAINEFTKYGGGGGEIYSPYEKIDPELLNSVNSVDSLIFSYQTYYESVKELQSTTQLSLKYIEDGLNRLHDTLTNLESKRAELTKVIEKSKAKNKKSA